MNQAHLIYLSRATDKAAGVLNDSNPAWQPLEKAMPADWRTGFMWMGTRVGSDNQPVETYKHGITRRYLMLDHEGWAFRPTSGDRTSVWEGVESVYVGLESTGHDRATPYTDDLIAERAQALRTVGWTVVHSQPLNQAD